MTSAKPLTFDALKKAMRILKGQTSIPIMPTGEEAEYLEVTVKSCVECGEWGAGNCVCHKPESLPPTCYLCSAAMGSRNGIIPRRCESCARRYLGA